MENIFGYGGMCHYNEIFHDIKKILNNDMNIMCYRVKRNKNLYTLIIYRVLVQELFIPSLWKGIILLTTFLISLFIKYGLLIIYEKFYLNCF